MSYEFQSTSYRTQFQMHLAIAEQWLCGGGSNSRDTMQKFLTEMSDEKLADDAAKGWELSDNPDFDHAELVDAFREIRADFDAHFPADPL
jgi:hypothetical protein